MVSNETFLDSDIYKIHLIFWMSLLKFEYLWCSVTNGAGGKKLNQGGDVESWATYWLCPSGDTNWKFQWVPVCHTEPFVLLVRESIFQKEICYGVLFICSEMFYYFWFVCRESEDTALLVLREIYGNVPLRNTHLWMLSTFCTLKLSLKPVQSTVSWFAPHILTSQPINYLKN